MKEPWKCLAPRMKVSWAKMFHEGVECQTTKKHTPVFLHNSTNQMECFLRLMFDIFSFSKVESTWTEAVRASLNECRAECFLTFKWTNQIFSLPGAAWWKDKRQGLTLEVCHVRSQQTHRNDDENPSKLLLALLSLQRLFSDWSLWLYHQRMLLIATRVVRLKFQIDFSNQARPRKGHGPSGHGKPGKEVEFGKVMQVLEVCFLLIVQSTLRRLQL